MKLKTLTLLSTLVFFAVACEKEQVLQHESFDQSSQTLKSAVVDSKFILISSSNKLSMKLESAVTKIKGSVVNIMPEIGLAVVESNDPNFALNAKKIRGISAVVPDVTLQFIDPDEKVIRMEDYGNPPASGDDDFFFDFQWGHDAIDAPEAWELGYRGAGVRVGVLDGGFDLDHPDLAPNINMDLSADFTGEGLQYASNGFSHGSHVAGTIAAADNGYGIIGVAPEAELVSIKVISDIYGYGSFSNIMAGVYYAAMVECDVINMSIGGYLYKSGNSEDGYTAKDAAELVIAFTRVLAFANQQGVTVMTSAGNESVDFDHTADLIHIPSDIANAISISATAPVGWAVDPTTNLDVFASYSNYGQSAINFAAPGGDYQYYFINPTANCVVIPGIVRPCYVFDYVFSCTNNGWAWAVGTSMATPHATGVAALIIGKNGGSMQPKQVIKELINSSDDLGNPGKDDYYGMGRVNAMKAVMD